LEHRLDLFRTYCLRNRSQLRFVGEVAFGETLPAPKYAYVCKMLMNTRIIRKQELRSYLKRSCAKQQHINWQNFHTLIVISMVLGLRHGSSV